VSYGESGIASFVADSTAAQLDADEMVVHAIKYIFRALAMLS
jgi:hypothetical protein